MKLSESLRFGQVIVYPLNNPSFPFYLRDIKIIDLQTRFLFHMILDLFIGNLTLYRCQVHLIHREFHFNRMLDIKFGQ